MYEVKLRNKSFLDTLLFLAENENSIRLGPDLICSQWVGISLLDAKFNKSPHLTLVRIRQGCILQCESRIWQPPQDISPGWGWIFDSPSLLGRGAHRRPPVVESVTLVRKVWIKFMRILENKSWLMMRGTCSWNILASIWAAKRLLAETNGSLYIEMLTQVLKTEELMAMPTCGDSVDVTSQMQIEFVHRNNLGDRKTLLSQFLGRPKRPTWE